VADPSVSSDSPGPLERPGDASPARDPFTAMAPRFSALAHAFAERFFSGFALAPEEVERLHLLEARGAVVYVMRYTSRLDYFLFNWLFLRSGIRLTDFANGIRLLP